jgi:hypothetical protein
MMKIDGIARLLVGNVDRRGFRLSIEGRLKSSPFPIIAGSQTLLVVLLPLLTGTETIFFIF